MYAEKITELIGKTPLVKLKGASASSNALVLGKCEFMNPASSIKDRVGYYLVKDALDRGVIDKNSTIIEPSSGNTGIGLAATCAS